MEDNSVSQAPVEGQGDVNQEPKGEQQAQPQDAPKPDGSKRKYKLKVDGQEFEEEIDLSDEEAIKRHLQMSKAAQKRMSEAAKARREAEQFIHTLKTNPRKVLTDPNLGVDFRKLAEEYLAEQLEAEMLTPEQRRLREVEAKLREREEQDKARAEEEQAKQLEQLRAQYAQDYDKTISEALQTEGLPKTPKTVKRMAELMYKNLDMGLELEPKQLVSIVREDYINEIKELFSSADGETLLKLLGDDVAKKIRKTDLARLKTKPLETKRPSAPAQPEPSQKRVSTEEWLAEVRRRAME